MHNRRSGWHIFLCSAAAEASSAFVGSLLSLPRDYVCADQAANSERARAEASWRAHGRPCRYYAVNRLNRLGTLTHRPPGCHDPRQARADGADFFRHLRDAIEGGAFAYVWAPGWCSSRWCG